jgi:AraC-like DNA-binding protein
LHPTPHVARRSEPFFSAEHLLAAAERYGADVEAISVEAGLTHPQPRIPNAQFFDLWHSVARQLPDPAFALRVLLDLPLEAHRNPITFYVAVAPTFLDGIQRWLSCWPAGSHLLKWGMRWHGTNAVIFAEPLDAPSPARSRAIECFVVDMLQGSRLSLEAPVRPGIVLPHDRPAMRTDFRRMLGVDVEPGDRLEFHFTADTLALPYARADAALSRYFEHQVEQLMAPFRATVQTRVRRVVMQAIVLGERPPLVAMAARMGMSPATLQRQLKSEGTSYREVVEGVQQAQACAHLVRPGVRSSDVAYAVGFSSQRAFCRAFRRWTGMSPTAWSRGARDKRAQPVW